MFCVNCGNRLPDNAKFCNQCGKPVAGAAPVAPPPVVPVTPVAPPSAAPVEPVKVEKPVTPPAAPKQKKPASAASFVALLLVGLLLLAAGGFTAYRVYGNVMLGNPPFENFFDIGAMNHDEKEEPEDQNGNGGNRNPSNPGGNTQGNDPGTTTRPNAPTVPATQAPVATEAPDTYTDSMAGLSYVLTGDVVPGYTSDEYREYSGDHFEVYIYSGSMGEVSDGEITTSREFAEYYAELYDMSANRVKNESGVYYIEVEDENSIMGFYTDGETGWIIVCMGDLTYRDTMIFIATSGWIN